MSRLARRLKGYQGNHPQYNQEADFYPLEENYEEGLESTEYQGQSPMQQSPLVDEYNRLQAKAEQYQKELEAVEKTNPHTLFKEVVTDPTPKGLYEMRVFGRPIDLSSLEHYVIHKISPKSVTTLMKYNNSKVLEEIKGYSKRPPLRVKSGIIWLLIGAGVLLTLGLLLITQGPNMTEMFEGMFGGLGP